MAAAAAAAALVVFGLITPGCLCSPLDASLSHDRVITMITPIIHQSPPSTIHVDRHYMNYKKKHKSTAIKSY